MGNKTYAKIALYPENIAKCFVYDHRVSDVK